MARKLFNLSSSSSLFYFLYIYIFLGLAGFCGVGGWGGVGFFVNLLREIRGLLIWARQLPQEQGYHFHCLDKRKYCADLHPPCSRNIRHRIWPYRHSLSNSCMCRAAHSGQHYHRVCNSVILFHIVLVRVVIAWRTARGGVSDIILRPTVTLTAKLTLLLFSMVNVNSTAYQPN